MVGITGWAHLSLEASSPTVLGSSPLFHICDFTVSCRSDDASVCHILRGVRGKQGTKDWQKQIMIPGPRGAIVGAQKFTLASILVDFLQA